jgi:hypothetical protein
VGRHRLTRSPADILKPPLRHHRRLAAIAFALTMAAGVPSASAQQGTACGPAQLAQSLREDQAAVLAVLGHLTTLDSALDLAELIAKGWALPPHQFTSFKGVGWGLYNPIASPAASPLPLPTAKAGMPPFLFFEPTGTNVSDPRDGPDFPYHLRGWAYIANYDWQHQPEPPLVPRCIPRSQWFVHERGIHPLDTGGFLAAPPEESVHGTAAGPFGSDPAPLPVPGIPHTRSWDLHVWLDGDDVPTLSILAPSPFITTGQDILTGVSPPPNWPNGQFPAFYYPPPLPAAGAPTTLPNVQANRASAPTLPVTGVGTPLLQLLVLLAGALALRRAGRGTAR